MDGGMGGGYLVTGGGIKDRGWEIKDNGWRIFGYRRGITVRGG